MVEKELKDLISQIQTRGCVSSQADNRFFSKMVDRGAQTSNHLFL